MALRVTAPSVGRDFSSRRAASGTNALGVYGAAELTFRLTRAHYGPRCHRSAKHDNQADRRLHIARPAKPIASRPNATSERGVSPSRTPAKNTVAPASTIRTDHG